MLRYCAENAHLLVTHDKKDFAGELTEIVDHAGVVVYTDSNYLRDDPEGAVHTFERIRSHYPTDELAGEFV